ncbi:MAG: DUF2254 domain-containing protein [Candidatus Microthrix sp.]|nr:DUF2254 domain-containing protein [Candidatus Microthrix sp.]
MTATALSGRGPENIVPYRALIAATVLTAASIAWFLALIARTSDNLRVAHVIQRIDSQARRVFDDVYRPPAPRLRRPSRRRRASTPTRPCSRCEIQTWGGVLVAADRDELLRIAQRHNAVTGGERPDHGGPMPPSHCGTCCATPPPSTCRPAS